MKETEPKKQFTGSDYFREGIKYYLKKNKRERNQKVIAALAGISQPYLSQILSGADDRGSFTTYDKIALACGLTLEKALEMGRALLEGEQGNQAKLSLPPELLQKLSGLEPQTLDFLSAWVDTFWSKTVIKKEEWQEC